jgi:RNA polymerase sigma factor (sigma-70 family)
MSDPNVSAADQILTPDEYRELRKRLILYFRQRGAVDPEELTDETVERLVRRLNQGVELTSGLRPFCFGIAANVLSESRKKVVPEELPPADTTPEREERLAPEKRAFLRQMLNRLSREDAEVLAYYYLEDAEELARRLGIKVSALRVRISRIRSQLRAELAAISERKSVGAESLSHDSPLEK